MKKIKLIFILLAIILLVPSCTNDGGSSKINFTVEGVPNIQKIATTDQSLNLVALKAGQNINLGLTVSVGRGDVASIDIIGIYYKGNVVEKAMLKSNITTFPATVNITQTDLFSAFNLIKSANDVAISDKLVISADLKLTNGTVVKMFTDEGVANYGADTANSLVFSVLQNYAVSCPLSDASLFNGDYKVKQDDWQDYSVGDIIPVVYNAANGLLTFRILNINNPYIYNSATSYMICVIDPATSKVTLTANEVFDYGPGYGPTTGTGLVASCTGDISLTLAFGPYGGYHFNLVKQ